MSKFTPTEEMIKAAMAVFVAMTEHSIIEEVVLEYKTRILGEKEWKVSPQFRSAPDAMTKVTRPQDDFMMTTEDFLAYHARCNEELLKANLVVENYNQCPLDQAAMRLLDAKFLLVDQMEKVTGVSSDKLRQSARPNLERFCELTLKLLAPYVQQNMATGN